MCPITLICFLFTLLSCSYFSDHKVRFYPQLLMSIFFSLSVSHTHTYTSSQTVILSLTLWFSHTFSTYLSPFLYPSLSLSLSLSHAHTLSLYIYIYIYIRCSCKHCTDQHGSSCRYYSQYQSCYWCRCSHSNKGMRQMCLCAI